MEIIYEDAQILVCYKEAGLAVQSADVRRPDLESRLRLHLSQRGVQSGSLHVVHRLDQPVHGLVLFALTKKAASVLGEELTDGRMKKTYLARVRCVSNEGRALLEKGAAGERIRLEDHLLRDAGTNTSRIVSAGTKGAKKASLDLAVKEFDPEEGEALLEIRLHTGRHHQIRVQLAGAGLPIIGDRRYGADPASCMAPKFPCLCAYRLSFEHPHTGAEMTFEVPGGKLFGADEEDQSAE